MNNSFDLLIEGLKDLFEGKKAAGKVIEALDEINAYFELDRYNLMVHPHGILS